LSLVETRHGVTESRHIAITAITQLLGVTLDHQTAVFDDDDDDDDEDNVRHYRPQGRPPDCGICGSRSFAE